MIQVELDPRCSHANCPFSVLQDLWDYCPSQNVRNTAVHPYLLLCMRFESPVGRKPSESCLYSSDMCRLVWWTRRPLSHPSWRRGKQVPERRPLGVRKTPGWGNRTGQRGLVAGGTTGAMDSRGRVPHRSPSCSAPSPHSHPLESPVLWEWRERTVSLGAQFGPGEPWK